MSSSRKRGIVLCGIIVLLSLVVLYQYAGSVNIFVGKKEIVAEKEKLNEAQSSLQRKYDELHRLEHSRRNFFATAEDLWILERDGNEQSRFSGKLEKSIETSGVKLTSIGSLKTKEIVEGIYEAETNISATGPVDSASEFFYGILRLRPKAEWVKCSLKPDNAGKPSKLNYYGTLRFIVIKDTQLAKMLLVENPKNKLPSGQEFNRP